MKKILFSLAALALILASCTKTDESVQTSHAASQSRVMHLTATVEEPAETRATLEEVGTGELKAIRFKWEVNDIIQMAFVQGTTKKTANATVTSVSADGRTAQFSVTVPAEITGNFTLYAYRSSRFSSETQGSELLVADPTIAVLPTNQWSYGCIFSEQKYLVSLWDKKEVAYTGGAMPAVSLSFKHLGAMMTVKIKNTGSAAITDVRSLNFNSTANTDWVRNFASNGMAQFNMASGSYVAGNEMLNYIFEINTPNLNAGEVKTLYVWFVPAAYTAGNAIQLIAKNGAYNPIGSSGSNTKNTADFQPGKNYVVYVTISGTSPNYVLKYSTAAWE